MPRDRIVGALEEMGHLLIIADHDAHKAPAYYRAARSVRRYPGDLAELVEASDLTRLDGVGPALSSKIIEVADRGSFFALDRLRESLPADILALTGVEGIGARTAGRLYRELGIENLSDLEAAIRRREVRALRGMGPGREENLSRAVADHYARRDLVPLYRAMWEAGELIGALESHPGVVGVHVAGPVRRRLAEVTRLDLVVVTPDGASVEAELPEGLDTRLWFCRPEALGPCLVRRTGSDSHWDELVSRASSMGMELDVRALTTQGRVVEADSESAVYEALGLQPVPPELREGTGEIEAAGRGELPVLVCGSDIRGDLHSHTTWSDGVHSVAEMAARAEEMGYEYLAITDHSQSLAIARGLDPDRLSEQAREVRRVRGAGGIDILHGTEVDITPRAELDFSDDVLEGLDVVVASIHTAFHLSEDEQTGRLLAACRSPHVDIIGHPTGRVLGYRSGYPVDLDRLVRAAADTSTALEINASPDRMDAGEELAARAAAAGVPLVISSDAHSRVALGDLSFGLYVARRAGVGPEAVLNAWGRERLRAWLSGDRGQ